MDGEQSDMSAGERLSRIVAVSDAALGHLGVEDLITELLERVRELLEVDTAAVLLLDRATNELVATAARGLEEEVRQGVRIPVGAGFAGRIAHERKSIVIADVDHADIRNPILRETGIRSLLGAPLVVNGDFIGVIHVGTLVPRLFDDHDVELLELVAERAARAISARRSNVEAAAAAALQRSLIPGRLPSVSGLELAGRYLPGEEGGVGGDWYDVFELPTGEVSFVIGDVVGRGLAAAVVMGRLRSALRAYALDSLDPADVLRRLDRKLQHFEAGQMTTVLYGVLSRSFDSMQLSIAGHLRPVLLLPSGVRGPIDAHVDPPLGIAPGVVRTTTTIAFPPGTLLAAFTDGLVERRGESLERALEKLTDALVASSAEQTCRSALGSMLSTSEPSDDVALIVVRREDGAQQPLRLRVPAQPKSLVAVRTTLRRWLSQAGVGEERSLDVLLAAGEVTANVVEHAYGPAGGDMVVVAALAEPHVLVVTVSDSGRWRPSRGQNRGRGMGIVEQCADEVVIDQSIAGTVTRLRFDLGQTATP